MFKVVIVIYVLFVKEKEGVFIERFSLEKLEELGIKDVFLDEMEV